MAASTKATIATLIDNNLADNSDIIPSEHRAVEDALNDSAINAAETTAQNIASDLNFATGKGPQFNGGDVLDAYEANTFTVTAVPETSGTITLGNSTLSYVRVGDKVDICGQITVSSVSSPVGAHFVVASLPFAVADYSERAGRFGNSATKTISTTTTVQPILGLEAGNSIQVLLDVSTIVANTGFYFSFTYFTDAA